MLDISGVIDVGPFYSTSKKFLCRWEFKFDAKRISLSTPALEQRSLHGAGICLKAATGLANVCNGPACRSLALRIVLAPNDGGR